MALPRFFLPAAQWTPNAVEITLDGDEAAHCARVLRCHSGDGLEIFDGAGRVAEAVITTVTKNAVQAAIRQVWMHPRPRGAVQLLPALIKGEAFEWLIEKAVELGAASIRPVITDHSVVQFDAVQAQRKQAKWQRHMIEAAKQCHTPFLPGLFAPISLAQAVRQLPLETCRIVAALDERTCTISAALHRAKPESVAIAIGPEGDFSPEEMQILRGAGFQPVTLGPLILRAETATVAALAIVGEWLRAETSSPV